MNIIKFQDIITESELFNESFKGKYAIAFNFKYIFPLGVANISESGPQIVYIEQQQISEMPANELQFHSLTGVDIEAYKNIDYILYDEWKELINWDNSNEILNYIYLNEFTTDDDITLDELKRFRTWLAEVLLENNIWIDYWSSDPEKLKNMLSYYAQEMYDQVVKSLSKFSSYVELSNITKQSGCGCQNSAVILNPDILSVCDPLMIYRHNVYKYMIEIFSNIDYWVGQVEICSEMKKYIDNIIKTGLPLASTTTYSNFADCTCINTNIDEQTSMTNILKRLSQSLEYIINDQFSGNRNYISSALQDWSTYLYEKMRW